MYAINDPRGLEEIQKLVLETDAKLHSTNRRGELICEIGSFKFRLGSSEEVFILREIFQHKIYDSALRAHPHILIDIGMNAGFASLYFASEENCQRVYSFEPFAPTFRSALMNFELNPGPSTKIEAYCLGLGARDFSSRVPYCELAKGRMTIYNLPKDLASRSDVQPQDIQIRTASSCLSKILSAHPNRSVKRILKIDCEGAEYEILPNLAEAGILAEVDEVMMEWHFKGSESLSSILMANGFEVESREKNSAGGTSSDVAGMLYGLRKLSSVENQS